MAGFVQTMKDWRRMCNTLGGVNCDSCQLHIDGNDCVAVYEGEMDYAKVEKAVTAWALENPEPVYPTWDEWLAEIGAFGSFKDIKTDYTDIEILCRMRDMMFKPIPASIAEKLGLEPKEGA